MRLRRISPIFPTSIVGIVALTTLCGCNSFSLGDGVDYSGPYENEVGACAEVSMKADLREDDGPVSTIWVRNVSVEATSAATLVHGETHTSDSSPRVYAWDCEVALDIATRTLTAEVTDFELVD